MSRLDKITNPLALKTLAAYVGDRATIGRIPPVGMYFQDQGRWFEEKAIARRFMEYPRFGTDIRGRGLITGFLKVRSKRNHEYGPFTLRIVFPALFPRDGSMPSVYLMSHRDRWTNGNDSHIEGDWRLCLYIAGESEIDFTRSDSLFYLLATAVTFLRKEVIYQKDYLKELDGGPKAKWPGGDRAHGVAGLVESIQERGAVPERNPCLCGSGTEFVNCCFPRVVREIDDGEAERFIIRSERADARRSVGAARPRDPLRVWRSRQQERQRSFG